MINRFSQLRLPNEEEIKKTQKIQLFFKKNVNEQRDRLQRKKTKWSKNAALDLLDYPLLKKQVKTTDEQQNHITIKTNINYIRNFISIF